VTERGKDPIRLDIWLWAARFYKTRSLASQAIELGRVLVAGERAKRSRLVRVGDSIVVRHPPFERAIIVQGVSDTRGPAAVAAELYEETEESRPRVKNWRLKCGRWVPASSERKRDVPPKRSGGRWIVGDDRVRRPMRTARVHRRRSDAHPRIA
jgi:ribosome-associated heat shock protein Hsp15